MPVRSVKNQYRGINAHLHSYWQARGGWPEFHTLYLVELNYYLREMLLPLNYLTAVEDSLQIRRLDSPDDTRKPESDLLIYDADPVRPSLKPSLITGGAEGELVMTIPEALAAAAPVSEKTYKAIKIYEAKPERGEPIAWIELLSPSNKAGGTDTYDYFDKRDSVIESGIVFIELDFLHETPPTLKALPRYPSRQPSRIPPHPYHILIVDPRPTLREGVARIIGFDVDAPIPTPKLALNADDVLTLNFDLPYHLTLAKAFYSWQLVDYREVPQHFERYSEDDQARIAARMLSVLKAAQAGIDLESGPFATSEISLSEGLGEIEKLAQQLS